MKHSDSCLPSVNVVRFLRRMRGGCQCSLVEADDGNLYVAKMLNNPQGSDVLFREAFASELMRRIGLPVPDWCVLHISNSIIHSNPSYWFEGALSDRRPPLSGLHFGSKFIATEPDHNLYEWLPASWIGRVLNRDKFVGMWLFDLWASNDDARQAVFLQQSSSRSLYAFFIDNGYLFSRTPRASGLAARRTRFIHRRVYRDVNLTELLWEWELKLLLLDESTLRCIADEANIPSSWYNKEVLDKTISFLISRQTLLGYFRAAILEEWLSSEVYESDPIDPYADFNSLQVRGFESCIRRIERARPRLSNTV